MSVNAYQESQVLLVALDLTKMDDHLIQYAKVLSGVMPFRKIYFAHITKNLEIPEDILAKFPDLKEPIDESLSEKISELVYTHFTHSEIDINIIVDEGRAFDCLMHLAKVKHADLILMGRKKNLKGSGLVSSHIARECHASILFVTEEFSTSISKILVATDFSIHSFHAVQCAEGIADKNGADIFLTHIYEVPMGYTKVGKTYEEFGAIMLNNAKKDYQKFRQRNKLPEHNIAYHLVKDESKSDLLFSYAQKIGADLVIMGSRGRTKTSAILMGSVAEKLVFADDDIPVFVVKNKGQNMGLLEAIRRL